MDGARKILEGSEWRNVGLVINTGSRYQLVGTYTFEGYDQEFYGLQPERIRQNRQHKSWGKLLNSSYRERLTYQTMRREIPIDKILEIIEDYWVLRLQIATQPAIERTVDVDISFASPGLR